MTTPKNIDDEELRKRFAELKRHDARLAPDFMEMKNAPRPARSRWRFIVPIVSMAAAAMVVLWCGAQSLLTSAERSAAAPSDPAAMGGEPTMPTMPPLLAGGSQTVEPMPLDFLLETPDMTRVTTSVGSNNPIKGW